LFLGLNGLLASNGLIGPEGLPRFWIGLAELSQSASAASTWPSGLIAGG